MSINRAMLGFINILPVMIRCKLYRLPDRRITSRSLQEIEEAGIILTKNRHYKILPYLKEMEYAYAVADLIVYRAGATGIAEITAKGIPAILIPYPHAAENHQEYNARNLEKQGAAVRNYWIGI